MGVWLHNFLVNRKQFVISEDAISNESVVISGIPQGTVLGPILFLIFICDIDEKISNFASMFADDTRLIGKIASEEDVDNFQRDLNLIYEWAETNNMQFNDKKFELMRYGPNEDIKQSTSYKSSDGSTIEEKQKLRDLGSIMNNEATFDDHIELVVSKVRQKTDWNLKTFLSRKPFVM